MDLVSESLQKLEPLPDVGTERIGDAGDEEAKWLEEMTEKAARNISDAQFEVGHYHFAHGNYKEALSYFKQAAGVSQEKPSSEVSNQAKYQLAVMYYDGLGVTEDQKQGLEYMLDVAQSKKKKDANIVSSAQYNVGRAYFMGFGVRQSDTEAERWWKLAAEHNGDVSSMKAQNTLGMFYSRSESLDLDKSFYWHREAAERGSFESMAALGLIYLQHQSSGGGNEDKEEGLEWLKKSADGGCIYGIGLLALHYFTHKLFSKAAETAYKVSELEDIHSSSGNSSNKTNSSGAGLTALDCKGVAMGCFVLARCLQLGQVLTKNDAKSQEYYIKAKKFDKNTVAKLHSQLTHGQL